MISKIKGDQTLIRFIAFSPERLRGMYRYKDVLQIFPLPDDAPQVEFDLGQHPLIVEYAYDRPESSSLRTILEDGLGDSSDSPPDYHLHSEYDRKKRAEILSVLSVISRYLITTEQSEHRWVLDSNDGKVTGKFMQTGYAWDGFSNLGDWFTPEQLKPVTTKTSRSYFNTTGITGEEFYLPENTDSLFEACFTMPQERREYFLASTSMFHQAMNVWGRSNSLSHIGVIASLETLIQYDNRKAKTESCSNCGQPMYKVRMKFLNFIETYCSEDADFRKYADKLYEIRSKIGHGGLLLSEDVIGEVISPQKSMTDYLRLVDLNRITRVCLINWLLCCKK